LNKRDKSPSETVRDLSANTKDKSPNSASNAGGKPSVSTGKNYDDSPNINLSNRREDEPYNSKKYKEEEVHEESKISDSENADDNYSLKSNDLNTTVTQESEEKFNTSESKIRGYVLSKLKTNEINAIALNCFENDTKNNVISILLNEEHYESYKPEHSMCLIKQRKDKIMYENEKDKIMDELVKLTQKYDGFGVVGYTSNFLEAAIVFPCAISEVKNSEGSDIETKYGTDFEVSEIVHENAKAILEESWDVVRFECVQVILRY